MEIVEYRGAHVDRREHDKSDKLPTKHKIKKGDTLRKLAKHYYKGQGAHWKHIKEANGGATACSRARPGREAGQADQR